jgi:hypothetical protein
MPTKQGDTAILDNPIVQELLHSTVPARLATSGLTERPESFRSGFIGMVRRLLVSLRQKGVQPR